MSTAELFSELKIIRQQNERIERKLSVILKESNSPAWVKAPAITRITGWKCQQMRTARIRGYVNWEKRADGYWYDMNSLNEKFLKIA